MYFTEVSNDCSEVRTAGLKVINVSEARKDKTSKPRFEIRGTDVDSETWLIVRGNGGKDHEIKIEAYPSHDFFQIQDILSFVARSEGFKVEAD